MNFFWHLAQHRPTFTPRQVTVYLGTTFSSVRTGQSLLNGSAPGAGTGASAGGGAPPAGAACCGRAAATPPSNSISSAAAVTPRLRARIGREDNGGSASAAGAVAVATLAGLLARLSLVAARCRGARGLELRQVLGRVLEEV